MQYQKEDVRNRIAEAAKTEFLRVGYYRASMLQISSKAKVPIGNLYRYFTSKAALFDAIVGTARDRIKASIVDINLIGDSTEPFVSGGTSLFEEVSITLAELSRNYHKEIILLLQKSGGSGYERFIDDCVSDTKELLFNRLGGSNHPEHAFVFDIIADNLIRGIFRIMIECPIEEQRNELTRLLVFYFNHIEDRV